MRQTLIFLSLLLLLTACSKTPDEEQIALNIAAIEEAVEAKSFSDLQDYLHPDFLANGRISAMEAKGMLTMYARRHRRLGVTIVGNKTTMDPTFPDRAETAMSVVVTGSSGGLPSDGSVRTVRLEWTKDAGDWLIRRANWQR